MNAATATTSALWCVKHKGRPIALVTGADRTQATARAAPLIQDMDAEQVTAAAVGDARPGAGEIVMDLRPPSAWRSQPAPTTIGVQRKRSPAEALAHAAAAAAYTAAGYTAGVNPRSRLAIAARHGFWRAASKAGIPLRIIADASDSHHRSVGQYIKEAGHDDIISRRDVRLAEEAAARVFAAGHRVPC